MNLFLILVSVAFAVAQGMECPDDWISFQDSCYIFVNDVATWTGGQTICRLLNSYLVEIETPDENNFIVSHMKANNVGKVWLGFNDFVREGQYVWSSTMEVMEYSNWAPGEPNNDATDHGMGDQDCGALYSTGLWDDEYCESTHKQRFFCERTRQMESIIG